MKKFAFCLFVFSFLFGCDPEGNSAANAFTIRGELTAASDNVLYLQKYVKGEFVAIDSTEINKGKFSFSGKMEEPQRFYLAPKGKEGRISFFMGKDQVEIQGHIDSLSQVRVFGSALEDSYQAFQKSMEVFKEEEKALITKYWAADAARDEEAKEATVSQIDQIDNRKKDHVWEYVNTHAQSAVSAYLAFSFLSHESSHEQLEEILATFDTSLTGNPYVQMMTERAARLRKVAVGQPAVDFALENPEGEKIALSSYKGKYLLIDFWASWCGPCRRENPAVVAMYKEMKGKDFDILGVSLDTDRDRWLQAIADDGLSWAHVSDLKGWACEAGKLYAVNSIPHTVLLDKEGTIIAKNLRGEALRAKLEELLN